MHESPRKRDEHAPHAFGIGPGFAVSGGSDSVRITVQRAHLLLAHAFNRLFEVVCSRGYRHGKRHHETGYKERQEVADLNHRNVKLGESL